MSQDIRDLNVPLSHWNPNPGDPGHSYCYGIELQPFRIYIARKSDFEVIGSFPSFVTAAATMVRLYQLEAQEGQQAA